MMLSGLCVSCENAQIINNEMVTCHVGFGSPMRVRNRVDECTKYDKKEAPQKPFRWLLQDAWIFYTDHKDRQRVARPRTKEHAGLM
jgi:hypothetical protein